MKASALVFSAALVLSGATLASSEQSVRMVPIEGGVFESVLPPAPNQKSTQVKSFRLDVTPVTNAQFAAFVKTHSEWRRDRIAKLFSDASYLVHWREALEPGDAIRDRPVTNVSWYAARAYCAARGVRLPRWYEWEFAAAASEKLRDARQDPAWRQRILDWYAAPNGELPRAGASPANFFGVRDLHGVIWEWVDDFNGMLVSNDSREGGDPDITRFCGTGALSMEQKDQYAVLMRVAMLSSLQAKYATSTLGFRCAADGSAR
jgi:formylglycine-generating enzyme